MNGLRFQIPRKEFFGLILARERIIVYDYLVPACLREGSMAVIVYREGSCVILTIQDEPIFREFNFSQLVLKELQDSDLEVVLDLALVTTLHSPGLANLVAIHVNLAKRGKKLRLANLNDHNKYLLKATNLDQLLSID